MRLSRSRDVTRVFKSGLKISTAHVTIRAHKRGRALAARLAFAVAQKHVDSAVRRNRIKRIVRESFRRHADELEGFDVVVISRPGIAKLDPGALRSEVDRQWRRLAAEGFKVPRRGASPRGI